MNLQQSAIIDRIIVIMRHFSFNQSSMAKAIGIKQPNLSAILSGKRTCEEAVINKIVLSLDINKSWLMTGEGEMISGNVIQNNRSGDNFNGEQIVLKDGDTHEFFAVIERKDKQIEEKDRQINRLLAIIEKMQG